VQPRHRAAVEVPQERQGETLVQPPNPADTTEAVYKELKEVEQQNAISAASTLSNSHFEDLSWRL
jgi:hypothetical protein